MTHNPTTIFPRPGAYVCYAPARFNGDAVPHGVRLLVQVKAQRAVAEPGDDGWTLENRVAVCDLSNADRDWIRAHRADGALDVMADEAEEEIRDEIRRGL